MPDIVVSIVRGGSVTERVTRPLRDLNGKPAVTYRRELRPVRDGYVFLDDVPLQYDDNAAIVTGSFTNGHATARLDLTATPVIPPEKIEWDEKQTNVIEQPRTARILVDAGPGTGKTAVACARAAKLIEKGLEPGNLWIISFTRTAVYEVRSRIRSYVKSPGLAAAVSIATIDSHAWALHSGFEKNAKLSGLYDDNIENVLDKLETDLDLMEFLESIEHLIVDEAQDVIGIRADFVDALINRLPKSCGITVFSDRAQSIYDWAEEETVKKMDKPP